MASVKDTWKTIKKNVDSTPTMVLSVIGDSKSYVPKPWAKTVFQTALIEAAKSGGESWILYRGNGIGVSDTVRKAYRDYGHTEFEKHTVKSYEKDHPGTEKPVNDVDRHVKLIRIAGDQTIYDASTPEYIDKSEHGQGFLLNFEKFVSEQVVSPLGRKSKFKMRIPIVIIVCEGDGTTIEHTSKALENQLPVIIIKGSGQAADLMLNYLDDPDKFRKKEIVFCGKRLDDDTYNTLGNIKENANLVRVFDVDKDVPLMISSIVGEAVINAWEKQMTDHGYLGETFSLAKKLKKSEGTKEEIMNQLYLDCMVSQPYVLNPMYSSPTSLPISFYIFYQHLQKLELLMDIGGVLLLETLKANRCDYVTVLMDEGIGLQHLTQLYQKAVSCEKAIEERKDLQKRLETLKEANDNYAVKGNRITLDGALKELRETNIEKLCHLYKSVMENLEQSVLPENVQEDKSAKIKQYKMIIGELDTAVRLQVRSICCKILEYKEYRGNEQTDKETSNSEKNDKGTASMSDLLLWALFANRRELAKIFWLRGKDHLLTGLICSVLLHKLAKKIEEGKNELLSSEYEEHSKMFEQRCIAIMDSMFKEDPEHAIELMDDETVVWGIKSSPLVFAYENFMYDVVAHICSQKKIARRWYSGRASDLVPFFKRGICKLPVRVSTAPRAKYLYNYFMFFVVLMVYSFFVLTSISTEFYVQSIAKVFEYLMYFWALGDFIEEAFCCFGSKGLANRRCYAKMKRYLHDFWNKVDLLSYILLVTALCVRHAYPSDTFTCARRIFSLALLVMYMRFLEIFRIHRRLGPTVIMIMEMLKDLFHFLLVAVVIVIGVGIYYHANLWPDHQGIWDGDWKKWRIWKIIYYPYFQLYGELFNDFLEGKDMSECSNITSEWQSDPSIERCPQEDWTVLAISAMYMLFSNLVLVSVVIAMFSSTFERIKQNSEILWKFDMCTVIYDYEWRIPSPFNLFVRPITLCLQRCHNRNKVEDLPIEEKEPEPGLKERSEHKKSKEKREPDKFEQRLKKMKAKAFRRNLQSIAAFRLQEKL